MISKHNALIVKLKRLKIWLLSPLLLSVLTGCQLTASNKDQMISAEQVITQHFQSCQLTEQSESGDNTVEVVDVFSQQEIALNDFLLEYCQQSYRNPADTSKALNTLKEQYNWPIYVLEYLALLDQQLLHHRKALSARALLRRQGEKSDLELSETIATLKETSRHLEQTLSSLAKTEQDLLLRQLGRKEQAAEADKKPATKKKIIEQPPKIDQEQ